MLLQVDAYIDVNTSSSAHIADPEVLPQGPVTRERTRILELKPSSVEARRFVCSLFQLNEADTPSASSIQLNTTPFSSTSAPLAQLKLNNPEAVETRLAYGRVPYKHVDSLWTSKHVHGTLFEHIVTGLASRPSKPCGFRRIWIRETPKSAKKVPREDQTLPTHERRIVLSESELR
ncbi:hypothetical protein GQ457_15G017900 [Hibiscus cannabinus]